MQEEQIAGILDFLHQAEKLKNLLRHSWTSSGRRESVAEHSWRMALMAMVINPYLEKSAKLETVIKMCLVHDLCEINYRDNPAFKKQPLDKAGRELKAMKKLLKPLPADLQAELLGLWQEYEASQTAEAKLAKALDKLEVLIQHSEADLKYLTKPEIPFNFLHGTEQTNYDSFLKQFRKIMNDGFLASYQKNNIDEALYKHVLDS